MALSILVSGVVLRYSPVSTNNSKVFIGDESPGFSSPISTPFGNELADNDNEDSVDGMTGKKKEEEKLISLF